MLKIKKHIPNSVTILNLICGFLSIIFVFQDNYQTALYFFIFALVFDFFDGLLARLLKVQSDFGKELDSLSDVVSFGVLPGVIMFKLMSVASYPLIFRDLQTVLPYVSAAIPAFSALRLAKFNLDTRQSNVFLGLPTPANAIVVASLLWISISNGKNFSLIQDLSNNFIFLFNILVINCLLLVSELPLLALKFKDFSIKNNLDKFALIAIVVLLVIFLKATGVFLTIYIYILMSIFFANTKQKD